MGKILKYLEEMDRIVHHIDYCVMLHTGSGRLFMKVVIPAMHVMGIWFIGL